MTNYQLLQRLGCGDEQYERTDCSEMETAVHGAPHVKARSSIVMNCLKDNQRSSLKYFFISGYAKSRECQSTWAKRFTRCFQLSAKWFVSLRWKRQLAYLCFSL